MKNVIAPYLICLYTCEEDKYLNNEFYCSKIGQTLRSLPGSEIIEIYGGLKTDKPELHKNILMLSTPEDYQLLSLKTWEMINFCVNNFDFHNLIKIDVTTAIASLNRNPNKRILVEDPNTIVNFLNKIKFEHEYSGWKKIQAKRSSIENWACNKGIKIDYDKVFPDEEIPPYYSGKCYQINYKFADFISTQGYEIARQHAKYLAGSEDLFIGRLYQQYENMYRK